MKKFQNYLFMLLIFNLLTAFISPLKRDNFQGEADKASYLSDLEREVVAELNLARSQPAAYTNYLIAYSKLFVGKELQEPGHITILTREGKSAVDEAIKFLKNQKPLSLLTASKGMSRAAKDMVIMQETTSQTGHIGTDRSTFDKRISRYGTWSGTCAENIDYGNNTARKIVMALIIDDGVSNRGHRKTIFDAGFKRVGVACGLHKKFNYMCVIEYAVNYTEK